MRCPSTTRFLRSANRTRRAGYTLVEMLIVVTMLGLAAAMVIPSISSASSLRVQGALRSIVADITVAQSDAVAFQRQRALVFRYGGDAGRYVMAEVNGSTIDTTTGILEDRQLNVETMGFTRVTNTFNAGTNAIVFDELGGPVTAAGSTTPASTTNINLTGSNQNWRITVEAYTGRVTITQLP
ncbi:MAG TPA: prepilin-type N-terminal cleavage/methylation domain-containing protein [Phycisphaerales bacterium]|nr:prepilin-type N-terminal cleavage/methylation domain-containing protein [Phycisphaerales bacterium]